MKKLHSKKLTKQVTLILTIVMLCNFVMPNLVYAETDTENGGELFDPIAKFLVFLCDNIFQFLQDSFISLDSIEKDEGIYEFKYTPATIFAGDQIPMFDINFISPSEDTVSSTSWKDVTEYIKDVRRLYEWYKDASEQKPESFTTAKNNPNYKNVSGKCAAPQLKNFKYDIYYLIGDDGLQVECEFRSTIWQVFWLKEEAYTYYSEKISLDDPDLQEYVNIRTYESVASHLHETISTWYKALRRIALVGLLSVLVYVGIRITAGSVSGKDSSKYKKMLVDWLTAICLLFTLHYLMNLTINVVYKISDIFISEPTDSLLNSLRVNIYNAGSWKAEFGKVIMYIVLTIYTLIFTVKYLKRVIYMAFLTMIAPLVTLTYPLDKISDGRAQAFNMWIREYIFNALIQVAHLLIYFLLVSSAEALVEKYPLYAIIVIGFMTQADGIIRKMFGFENATSVSTLQNIAAGGLIAKAVKSMKKPPKQSGGEKNSKESTKPVRTATTPTVVPRMGDNPTNSGAESVETTPSVRTNGARLFERYTSRGMTEDEANESINLREQRKEKIGRNINGIKAVGKKYRGPTAKAIKSALRTTGGAALGVAGGTMGFAMGVAQGDVQKAITGAAGGAAAGYYTGQKLVNKTGQIIDGTVNIGPRTIRTAKNIAKTFKE